MSDLKTAVPRACDWCGQTHAVKCPLIKAIDFHPDGSTRRIEFMTPVDMAPAVESARLAAPLAAGWGRG